MLRNQFFSYEHKFTVIYTFTINVDKVNHKYFPIFIFFLYVFIHYLITISRFFCLFSKERFTTRNLTNFPCEYNLFYEYKHIKKIK